MVAYLLDTNVVSELRKASPDPRVAAWYAASTGIDAYLSVLTVGEVRHGIERLRAKDPAQAGRLERWLVGLLRTYASRVLPITVEVAQEWGRLNAGLRPPVVDGLIAATARVHRLTLVTRNVADFAGGGVPLLNPFDG